MSMRSRPRSRGFIPTRGVHSRVRARHPMFRGQYRPSTFSPSQNLPTYSRPMSQEFEHQPTFNNYQNFEQDTFISEENSSCQFYDSTKVNNPSVERKRPYSKDQSTCSNYENFKQNSLTSEENSSSQFYDSTRVANPSRGEKRSHSEDDKCSEEVVTETNPFPNSMDIAIKDNTRVMSDEELEILENEIIRHIDRRKKKGPSFLRSRRISGCLLLHCADKETHDWLDHFVKTVRPWEGAELILINKKQVNKFVTACTFVPKKGFDMKTFVSQLEKQNNTVDFRSWTLHNIKPSYTGIIIRLVLSSKCLPSIKKLNYALKFNKNKIKLDIKTAKGSSDESESEPDSDDDMEWRVKPKKLSVPVETTRGTKDNVDSTLPLSLYTQNQSVENKDENRASTVVDIVGKPIKYLQNESYSGEMKDANQAPNVVEIVGKPVKYVQNESSREEKKDENKAPPVVEITGKPVKYV